MIKLWFIVANQTMLSISESGVLNPAWFHCRANSWFVFPTSNCLASPKFHHVQNQAALLPISSSAVWFCLNRPQFQSGRLPDCWWCLSLGTANKDAQLQGHRDSGCTFFRYFWLSRMWDNCDEAYHTWVCQSLCITLQQKIPPPPCPRTQRTSILYNKNRIYCK